MINKYRDIISGSVLMLLAAVIFIASFTVKRITVTRIGSQFVPQIVSIFLAIIAISIIYNGIKNYKVLKLVSMDKVADDGEKANTKAVIATFTLMVVYVALLQTVGFMIMTSLYLFVQFTILTEKAERKYPVFVIVSIIVSVVIYYTFVSAFQLMLPAGILG